MAITKSLNILLLEPFYSGSHKQWADGIKKHSQHNITLSTLPGRHWKWRMHGAAVTFAERHKKDIGQYDLVIISDMCDVATFRGLLEIKAPLILYFHENQFAYPWSATDNDTTRQWDKRYMWINFTSALAADTLWFNSAYNRNSLLQAIPSFLEVFPEKVPYDHQDLEQKSTIVPLGIDLTPFLVRSKNEPIDKIPVIVWNHRWEYDKGPELFFNTLYRLSEGGAAFKLVVLGNKTRKYPPIFKEAQSKLKKHILHFGSVNKRLDYEKWLMTGDLLPVTSQQDFFGISVVEGVSAGMVPLLPKGLAFEEHISPGKYPELFFSSEEEFFHKLNTMIDSFQPQDISIEVEKYNWNHMIKKYDKLLTKQFLHAQ
jgi:glycosyltransferase involved in cell wall biosynthesis